MYLTAHPDDNNYYINGFNSSDLSTLSYKHLYYKQMFDNNHLPFTVSNKPLEQYVYLYPIRSDLLITYPGDDMLSDMLKDFSFTIPDKVLEDIRCNKCKILIDNSIEAYDVIVTEHDSTINQIILRTIKKYNLKKTDIILITGNYKTVDSEHYLVAIKNWSDTLVPPCNNQFFEEQKQLILSKSIRPKNIVTFMRKERLFRFHLAKFIYDKNLKQHNIVTFGKNVSQFYWELYSNKFDEEFINSLPWQYDVDICLGNNGMDSILAKSNNETAAYKETYINCVAERSIRYLNYELDISEKIFKPIAFLQPFLVFGQPGTLEYMKGMGYKTFSNWWDESYDCMTSESIRFRMLTALYKKLSLTSKEELAEIMFQAWPVLEHNYYTYCDYVSSGKSNENLLKTIKESFDK
jgi:hypothetical protein